MRCLALLAALVVAAMAAPVANAQFALQVAAPFDSRGYGLAATADGYVLVGEASGTFDADPGPSTATVTASGGLATAYALDGSFRWAWAVPTDAGTERSVLKDAALRPGGGAVVVGQLRGTVELGAAGTVSARDGLLVAALGADGAPVWAFASDGSGDVLPEAVATDEAGNLYIVGTYSDRPDLDPGPGEVVLPFADRRVGFVASYSASGALRWAFNLGAGAGNVRAEGVAVGVGGVFVTGHFLGTYDFDPGPGEAPLTSSGGGYDGFVARYTTGGALGWAAPFGRRSRSDYGYAVAPDGDGGAFVGGSRAVVDGSQTWGQAYVARFDGAGALVWDLSWGGARSNGEVNRDEVHAVAFDGTAVTVGGWLYAAADVDPAGPGETVLVPDGFRQGFVARYRDGDGAFVEALDVGGDDTTDDVTGIALRDGLVTASGTFDGAEIFPDGTALTSASSSGNGFLAQFALGSVAPPPPLTLAVTERVGVSDTQDLLASLRLEVAERVGVADRVRFLEALVLAIEERIAVTDDPRLLEALHLMLQETVAALDGAGVVQADGSEAVSSFPIRMDGRVSFVGPVGLDVVLVGVTERGTVSVRFQSETVRSGRRADRAPFLWALRSSGGLQAEAATARFDLAALGDFRQPETVVVHWRPSSESAFTPLATSYDAGTGEAVAELPAVEGELVLVGEGVPTDAEAGVPTALVLSPPAPNPAVGVVQLTLDLPEPGDVRLEAFDATGRRVAVLVDGSLSAGSHTVRLRSGGLAPGVYVLRLTADAGTTSQRLTVVR